MKIYTTIAADLPDNFYRIFMNTLSDDIGKFVLSINSKTGEYFLSDYIGIDEWIDSLEEVLKLVGRSSLFDFYIELDEVSRNFVDCDLYNRMKYEYDTEMCSKLKC